MKNFLSLFIIILIFSCQNEKLYKERKAQKENDILNENKLTDCNCTESEFKLEQDFLSYLIDKKGFDDFEALTFANCGFRQATEYGNEIRLNPIEIISERIDIQYDKYGFNPYDDEISEEQKQTLANDSTFDPIFPYKIIGFGSGYSSLTSDLFTYEMFIGIINDDGPVSVLQPKGYAEPLTADYINEYYSALDELVNRKFFVEGVHYKMICPSRIKEENELLFGVDEVFIPCKEDIVINDFFEEGMADLDSDGLPDIEEMAYATDPNNPDTDGDGITDMYELYLWNTDPLDSESFPSENEIYYYENCEEKQ